MDSNHSNSPTYRVWGIDKITYGPVELSDLIEWIRDERVTPHNWIHIDAEDRWVKASEISDLQPTFQSGDTEQTERPVKARALRRIKILAEMDEQRLDSLLQYMEVVHARQFQHVVRQGDHGDAMYFILEGEVRASVTIGGRESILATLPIGEFFGEVSLLDHGPRSADVIANEESVLLKISSQAFNKLVREAPALATPFLFGLSRSVVGRMRGINKRYQDSIHFSRTAGLNT